MTSHNLSQSARKLPKQKSVSLPKLKTQTTKSITQNPNKLSDQIHRVKWSISPNCLIAGHQGKQILYICIYPQCKQSTRLVCQQCFYKQHEMHNQYFLAVDEVKRCDIQKLRYWPFDNKYRKIFQFVTQHQSYVNNMVQDINATFNSMAMRILSKIDKIRLNLLKTIDTFYIKETQKQKFSQKLKTDLQQCFELKKINQTVRQIFSKQIRHEVFIQKMNKLLNDEQITRNRQILLKYFQSGQKGTDMFFDKMHFLKKQNWIIQQIEQQKKSLKEQQLTIDIADAGIQKIVVQTIDYLNKNAQGMYPLTYNKVQEEDGLVYRGFYSEGKKALFGTRSLKNGFTYYGEWKNNCRSGWGIYQNKATGYKYAGDWKQDRKWGYGRQSTIGWVYQGNYFADKKQGFGVLIQDGLRWQIGWKNDKKHGKGKVIDKNGNQRQVYLLNGIETQSKANKASPAFDLKQLSKRFTTAAQSNET